VFLETSCVTENLQLGPLIPAANIQNNSMQLLLSSDKASDRTPSSVVTPFHDQYEPCYKVSRIKYCYSNIYINL